MDSPNLLTAIIAGIIALCVVFWILALAYDALVCWPRHRAKVADWRSNGCRCAGAWDDRHEESCQFYKEEVK